MSSHARLSASAAHRWIKCPGSIQLTEKLKKEKKIPHRSSSPSAREGTAAHSLLEWCLLELVRNGCWDISAKEYKGDSILLDSNDDAELLVGSSKMKEPLKGNAVFLVNDNMIEAVDTCINHVRSVLESMGASEFGIPDDIQIELEAKINLDHIPDYKNYLGGTVDVRIAQFMGELHIIDYKHGQGVPVSAVDNQQLLMYSLGSDIMDDSMPESVHLTIVQPRCPKVEPVQVWEVGPDHIRDWAHDMLNAVDQALSKNPPLNPGPSQCHWCKASAHCPATHSLAIEMAKKDFADEVQNLPDAKFVELFSQVDTIRQVCKALEERARFEMQSGKEIPGYKLVQKKTNRRWVQGAEEKLKEKKVPKKYMYETKLTSFTKLEKIPKYKKLVESLVVKPEGEAVVAPESDKRPAIASSIEADFADDI